MIEKQREAYSIPMVKITHGTNYNSDIKTKNVPIDSLIAARALMNRLGLSIISMKIEENYDV